MDPQAGRPQRIEKWLRALTNAAQSGIARDACNEALHGIRQCARAFDLNPDACAELHEGELAHEIGALLEEWLYGERSVRDLPLISCPA